MNTRPEEFKKHYELLMKSAPEGYEPFYFRCKKNGKDPDVMYSWKSENAKLTFEEAYNLMKKGYNIGLAGTDTDSLINMDFDTPDVMSQRPEGGLRTRSRGVIVGHVQAFTDPNDKAKTNIPTDKGEVRAKWQYVIVPGSCVPITDKDIDDKIKAGKLTIEQGNQIRESPNRGVYVVEPDAKPPIWITYDDLPELFRNQVEEAEKLEKEMENKRSNVQVTEYNGNKSVLFSLQINDVAPSGLTRREPHPLHDSDTGTNWMVSSNHNLGHCWRHLVSLNPIQYLCVASGYMKCQDAGSAHRDSKAGPSKIIGDKRAIWEAWRYAKSNGYIPIDDPVPASALSYLAQKHGLIKNSNDLESGWKLPIEVYSKILKIIEEEY